MAQNSAKTGDILIIKKTPKALDTQGFSAFFAAAFKNGVLERVMGIEPTQPAWKAGILTIELHPQTTFSILANKMQKVNIKL